MEYPTIYIRPASTTITNTALNFLDGYTALEEVKAGAKLEIEKAVVEELADGSVNVASEKISLESATLKVDIATLSYLQSLKGSMIDVILLDINVPDAIIRTGYRMRLNVGVLAQNDQSAIIRLSAEREFPSSALASAYTEHPIPANYGIAAGVVTNKLGNRAAGALVKFGAGTNEQATTNADGKYQIFCVNGAKTVATTLAGLTFPATATTVMPYETVQHNIQATA